MVGNAPPANASALQATSLRYSKGVPARLVVAFPLAPARFLRAHRGSPAPCHTQSHAGARPAFRAPLPRRLPLGLLATRPPVRLVRLSRCCLYPRLAACARAHAEHGGEHVRRVAPNANAAVGKREWEQPIGGVGGAAMTRTHPRGLRDQAPRLLSCPRDRQRSVAIRVRLPSETNILCPLRTSVPSRFNPSPLLGMRS